MLLFLAISLYLLLKCTNYMVGWHTPKKRLIKEVSIHHKKMDFFLHNIFIWCLEVQKSDVVLTDNCQIYGLPLTSNVILAKI